MTDNVTAKIAVAVANDKFCTYCQHLYFFTPKYKSMFTAISKQTQELIEPLKKGRAICKCCGSEVIAKCGTINVHHWAHKSKIQCDNWYEPMTQWHKDWQSHFPKEWNEKVMFDKETGEKHIADVHTPSGVTIEVQHSSISIEEFRSRNHFYKKLIWIIDGSKYGLSNVCVLKTLYQILFKRKAKNEFDNMDKFKTDSEGIDEYVNELMEYLPCSSGVIGASNYLQRTYIEVDDDLDFYNGIAWSLWKSGLGHNEDSLRKQLNRKRYAYFSIRADLYYIVRKSQAAAVKIMISRKRAIYKEFDNTNVFIDNIKDHPNQLYCWNLKKFISKKNFLDKYANSSK